MIAKKSQEREIKMNFSEAATERSINAEPFSQDEIDIVLWIVKNRIPGFGLEKFKKIKMKISPGSSFCDPYNPVTQKEYENELKSELNAIKLKNNWCGHFAGAGQWNKIDRVIKNGENGFIAGHKYDRDIVIFAYEQTEPVK